MIPGFAFDYEFADFRIFFEIMGFWTPEYVEKKLGQLETLEDVEFPEHERVGRTLVRPSVLDEIAAELDAGDPLFDAEAVFDDYGVEEDSALLSELGYAVEWDGLSGGSIRSKEWVSGASWTLSFTDAIDGPRSAAVQCGGERRPTSERGLDSRSAVALGLVR